MKKLKGGLLILHTVILTYGLLTHNSFAIYVAIGGLVTLLLWWLIIG